MAEIEMKEKVMQTTIDTTITMGSGDAPTSVSRPPNPATFGSGRR